MNPEPFSPAEIAFFERRLKRMTDDAFWTGFFAALVVVASIVLLATFAL